MQEAELPLCAQRVVKTAVVSNNNPPQTKH